MSFISTIVKWHEKLFQNGIFHSKTTSLTVVLAIILGHYSYPNEFSRLGKLIGNCGNKTKKNFFMRIRPLFTTMDAGYFLV